MGVVGFVRVVRLMGMRRLMLVMLESAPSTRVRTQAAASVQLRCLIPALASLAGVRVRGWVKASGIRCVFIVRVGGLARLLHGGCMRITRAK